MEFAKYYNVTDKLNKMIEEGKLFSYQKDFYTGLYICEDTHCFWVSRVLEGYNEEFEQEEGKWLIERNKIDKYDFIDFLEEKLDEDLKVKNRQNRDSVIDCFTLDTIITNLILMDDDRGLENWDNCGADSYEQAIKVIDGGYGIIEFKIQDRPKLIIQN